jgi:orotate phosphoribosyltransferase
MNASERILGMNLAELRQYEGEIYDDHLSDEAIRHILQTCDALWLHSGDMSRPHVELTSGKCSNGFVDVLRVLRYTNLCHLMAEQLSHILMRDYKGRIDWVVGSDHAAATLSYEVARCFLAQHDFTEKGLDKTQLWKRFVIQPDEVVLQVEELVTTSGTLQAVRDGLRRAHPAGITFAPLVATLVNRSPLTHFEGVPIVSLATYDIKSWAPEECPLCAAGSPRVRPKHNWAALKG